MSRSAVFVNASNVFFLRFASDGSGKRFGLFFIKDFENVN